MRREARSWLLAAIVCALPISAHAQNWFERLVMPGELIEGHAKIQGECGKCHAPFSKSSQRDLCLDCHKDVAGDVAAKTGFHGRKPEVVVQECSHCHSDHLGRDADILLFDRETFDHAITDFALKGAHQRVGCGQCHEQEKKFRAASSACIDCHKQVEPHQGRLGKDCANCHSETAWRQSVPFDHSNTRFPLVGSHQKTSCAACHIGEVYKGLPTVCADCHRIQDVHGGRFGAKCETCHTPEKWERTKFDHDRDTDFVLLGKHKDVKCNACHTGSLYQDKVATNCFGCHQRDDAHDGQLGKACDTCHQPAGWTEQVVFDHDITRFPLIGLHVLVPCEGCHVSTAYRDAPTACGDCHADDDYHEGRLGKACATCHNPNGWARWVFNHDRQTNYPLDGAHAGLDCHACHTKARVPELKLSQACASCHQRDDKHKGQFGAQCGTCHVTTDFKTVRLRRTP